MYKYSRNMLPVVAALALIACSSGPSESDIQALLEAQVTQTNSMLKGMVGSDMASDMQAKIHEVTLHGCDEIRDATYRCDVEVDLSMPMAGRPTTRSSMTLTQTEAGWAATRYSLAHSNTVAVTATILIRSKRKLKMTQSTPTLGGLRV